MGNSNCAIQIENETNKENQILIHITLVNPRLKIKYNLARLLFYFSLIK